MSLLPKVFVALDSQGNPLPDEKGYRRVDPLSPQGRSIYEGVWDKIICRNVDALSNALRAAEVMQEDSMLRVLGRGIDNVDVLLAEVPLQDGTSYEDSAGWGQPRRLVLLEDKRRCNPQSKREVLAQILDYAQRSRENWSVGYLVPTLASHSAWLMRNEREINALLKRSEVLLVIAGDDINEDLLRLARRFMNSTDPLSLEELCLVALTVYQRGEERLFAPHVVSSVERHHREFAIRVTVLDANGSEICADVERDFEADGAVATRAAPLVNPPVKDFLLRAKKILDAKLAGAGTPYTPTDKPTKVNEYWYQCDDKSQVRLQIHFGGYQNNVWSPIRVGIYVTSPTNRDAWQARIETALKAQQLPPGTELGFGGPMTVHAFKKFLWEKPAELNDEALLNDVTTTLLQFEEIFTARKPMP